MLVLAAEVCSRSEWFTSLPTATQVALIIAGVVLTVVLVQLLFGLLGLFGFNRASKRMMR